MYVLGFIFKLNLQDNDVYCQLDPKHKNTLYKDDSETVFHGYKIKIMLVELVGKINQTNGMNITHIIQDEESS